jgi:hypothetical protein
MYSPRLGVCPAVRGARSVNTGPVFLLLFALSSRAHQWFTNLWWIPTRPWEGGSWLLDLKHGHNPCYCLFEIPILISTSSRSTPNRQIPQCETSPEWIMWVVIVSINTGMEWRFSPPTTHVTGRMCVSRPPTIHGIFSISVLPMRKDKW